MNTKRTVQKKNISIEMESTHPQGKCKFNKVTLWAGLTGIILLGAFLRFYQLGATSIGNEYYAATVKSMLTSWHNFFFVAFEPGGSISVDKPPVGFWLEASRSKTKTFIAAFPVCLWRYGNR